ncbi:MAG TPA: bifunctional homocysteine S-methyltransferase/methylenetetrahydrofolate reductase [Thermoanaerobaculia bacterium]
MQDFVQTLADSHIYLFDGAMGTMLYSRGFFINRCYDELNLREPGAVLSIHNDYRKAGAEVLETNTYGANRVKLRSFGLDGELAEINQRGAELAREAAGDSAWVAGAVGPLGIRLEPYGPTALEEARQYFREQIEALVAGGVDLILLETFSSLAEIEQGILAARDVSSLPVIAQVTIGTDCRTTFGDEPAAIARRLDAAGADVIGLNCSVGPDIMLDAVEKMAAVTGKKISAQPNAGLPRDIQGRQIYMASPEYMAEYGKRLILKGVKFLGGCCGTTPAHIRMMADAVRPLAPRRQFVVVEPETERANDKAMQPVPLVERSSWGARIARGEFVTTIEITPPKGPEPSKMLQSVRAIRDAGVHGVNIPDGPRAQNRMGAMAVAVLVQQQVGIEAILHYCCRDRNLLGMHSDLLGAAALGIRNLLLITGDPPKMGPYPEATAVFDIDSIGLTNMVNLMNRGLDLGGNPLGGEQTKFTIGVGVNPGHLDLDQELARLEWKVKAGAEYAITQPVFDVRKLESFLGRIAQWKLPIVAGIWPLISYRNAQFMNNEVPGVSVPEDVMERMRVASDTSKEHALREGVAIARETLAAVRDRVAGVQVSAPLGRVDLALQVFEGMTGAQTTVGA